MTRRFLDLFRASEEGDPNRLWVTGRHRWTFALLLGAVALLLQGFEVPILTEETPPFTLWQIPVLVAFLTLGSGPGLLAALLGNLDPESLVRWSIHPGIVSGASLYVLEAWIGYQIYRRLGSLPLALMLYWVGVGWILDWAIYDLWLGLHPEYVAVLFLKQLLNGVLYGTIAELLTSPWIRDRVTRLRTGDTPPVPIEVHSFRRIVGVAMVPAAIVAILYARAQYREVIQQETQFTSETAFDIATEIRQILDGIRSDSRSILPGLVRGSQEEKVELLQQYLESHPGIRIAGLVGRDGIVDAAYPTEGVGGVPSRGLDVSDRDYFRSARETLQTSFSDFMVGRVRIAPEDPAPATVLAEPLLTPDGSFNGVLALSVNVDRMIDSVLVHRDDRVLTLVDGAGVALGSTAPWVELGQPLDSLLRAEGGRDSKSTVLGDLRERTRLQYYPPYDGTLEARLGLNLLHGIYQPVDPPGWGILVAMPARTLHTAFVPTVLEIVAVFLLASIAVFVVVRRFAASLTHPVRLAQRVAESIRQGQTADDTLQHMATSALLEMRSLSDSLQAMQEALQERRRATEEREESLQMKLDQAQKLESIGLLAGGVAHDLNNLLTPILGFSDLGTEAAVSPESKEFFSEIRHSARNASELVKELLAFARRQVLEMESVDLVEELRECSRLLTPLLREDIELVVDLELDSATVLVDASQFNRILLNLAVNAQDAMPQGGRLTITLRDADEWPSGLNAGSGEDGVLLVSVRDTGEGIPEEIRGQVFEPFFTTREGKGTGLGLSTVYGIVQQHGGVIEMESEPGVGTEFRIYIPRQPGPARPSSDGPSEDGETPSAEASILLVEDDDSVRRVVSTLLQRSGYRIDAFTDAESALEALDGSTDSYDALITDVVLPGMPGPELHRRVTEWRPELPTLFVSGYGHDILSDRGLP